MGQITKKEFDAVELFRDIKEKISTLLIGKTLEEQRQIIADFKAGKIDFQKLTATPKQP
jgi:hypothetical protein